jgi:phage baseplate assembly protein W
MQIAIVITEPGSRLHKGLYTSNVPPSIQQSSDKRFTPLIQSAVELLASVRRQ